jgi:hypothetical protein
MSPVVFTGVNFLVWEGGCVQKQYEEKPQSGQ